jgi:predicted acylesterase/phospholipase RssA
LRSARLGTKIPARAAVIRLRPLREAPGGETASAPPRDVALVLSGGGVNGVMMELGFLRRIRESPLWPRVGAIFGTSSGALAGCMGALDRLDELERFLLELQPEDTFRPNRLWRLPLLGLHEYALPQTIQERIGHMGELARELASAERELVVIATDVSPGDGHSGGFELAYSSREADPEEMEQAILASAAISALVLPLRVGPRIATDGAWVRNFPLHHAYRRPEVETIVAFRYVARYPQLGSGMLSTLRRRFERFERVPPIRAFIAELREAEERERRGEPAHLPEMLLRLNRAAITRNTMLEEQLADEHDAARSELESLREETAALAARYAGPGRRRQARRAVEDRFAAARLPFGPERPVERITVRGSVAEVSLDPGFRVQQRWPEEAKLALIRRGYDLTDAELRAHEDAPAEAAAEG